MLPIAEGPHVLRPGSDLGVNFLIDRRVLYGLIDTGLFRMTLHPVEHRTEQNRCTLPESVVQELHHRIIGCFIDRDAPRRCGELLGWVHADDTEALRVLGKVTRTNMLEVIWVLRMLPDETQRTSGVRSCAGQHGGRLR